MHELFHLYPEIKMLLSSTRRNEDTFANFIGACRRSLGTSHVLAVLTEEGSHGFAITYLDVPPVERCHQKGFFHDIAVPIVVLLIIGPNEAKPSCADCASDHVGLEAISPR